MFAITWIISAVKTSSKPATFARDARLSEMGRFDRFMQRLCERLGLCRKAQE